MDLFEKVSDSVMSATQTVSEKAKGVADITKLQYEKKTKATQLKKKYYEIGKLYVDSTPEFVGPQFVDLFNEVEEIKARIKELDEQISKNKGCKLCPNCGGVNGMLFAYCSNCGAKMEEVIKEADIEDIVEDAEIDEAFEDEK